ncbi:MAG: hypothetical protein IPH48_11940 [bacterium]|nr:hypothetical protein [bacterium]
MCLATFANLISSRSAICFPLTMLLAMGHALPESAIGSPSPEGAPAVADEISAPDTLAGLNRTDSKRFDDPAYGVSITYAGDHGRATLYIYDAGMDAIPEDVDAPVVREAFDSACESVKAGVGYGLFKRADLKSRDELEVTAVWRRLRLLHAEFEIETKASGGQPSQVQSSHVFLTSHRGEFLKVRLTCLPGEGATRLVEAIAKDLAAFAGARDLGAGWKSEADFRKSEPAVRLVGSWLESHPGNPPEGVHKSAMAFVTAWLIGTPYVQLELDAAHLTSLQDGDCECTPFLTTMYMIGCGLHALEAPGADAAAVRLAGTQYMLRAHANLAKAGGEQSGCAALAPLAQANEAGMLAELLRQ